MTILFWIIVSLIGYIVGATLTRTLLLCSNIFEPCYGDEDALNATFTVLWPVGLIVFVGWVVFNVAVVLSASLVAKLCPNKVQ